MFSEEYLKTGIFVAKAFDETIYQFIYNRETKQFYSCDNKKIIRRLVLKPNPWIYYEDGQFEIFATCRRKSIIQDYIIDPDVFYDLVSCGKIVYSKMVADMYDLPIEYAYDKEYHTRDYKHSKNKMLVLNNLRNGNFN